MKQRVPASILDQITSALKEIEYGTVQITLHQGKVVQIDRTEKVRFSSKILPTDPRLLR
ncbi:YezD family protein [Kroppenstedtia pulmonis]|uniref:YezD family protein n=1 Tax=Kroppenstedtia pulmonis TaxID=1380685 RepID=UPI001563D352|nr:YezD family protein [Kroppenstedtia pulmonis]